MDDFDRILETALRRMIDPVVAGRPPERKARREASEPIQLLSDTPAAPVVEPVEAATLAVAPVRTV